MILSISESSPIFENIWFNVFLLIRIVALAFSCSPSLLTYVAAAPDATFVYFIQSLLS